MAAFLCAGRFDGYTEAATGRTYLVLMQWAELHVRNSAHFSLSCCYFSTLFVNNIEHISKEETEHDRIC